MVSDVSGRFSASGTRPALLRDDVEKDGGGVTLELAGRLRRAPDLLQVGLEGASVVDPLEVQVDDNPVLVADDAADAVTEDAVIAPEAFELVERALPRLEVHDDVLDVHGDHAWTLLRA